MYRIGLTGGIASGKSTVSAMLRELGAYIIDADEIARNIVRPNQPAFHDIVAFFGAQIVLPDGHINRGLLGEMIFKDKEKRRCLDNITHPYIKEEVEKSVAHAALIGEKIVVLDVPLLFEIGWDKIVDIIWVVYVDEEIQLSRLIERNSLSSQQAEDRVKAQMSLVEKVKQADVVIDNNLDIEYTKEQVVLAWQKIVVSSESLSIVKITE